MSEFKEHPGPPPAAHGGPAVAARSIRPSSPGDAPAIIALMRAARLQPHSDPAHLHWKYWQERTDWPGSRSFVLTEGRDLLAHVAVVPGALLYGGTRQRVIHMIDWAARREAAGAGVQLAKHVGHMADLVLAVGGSADTRRILPLMGYADCGTVRGYVRTLSPLAILARPKPSYWKVAPRIARSLLWSLRAPRSDAASGLARRVGGEEAASAAAAMSVSVSGRATFERSAEQLRHALDCPIVPVELYAVESAGQVGGYFLLSYAPGQARIADLWSASQNDEDWRTIIEAAVHVARRRGGLAELVAWASDPKLGGALQACGFHERLTQPICVRSPAGVPLPRETLRVQMLDSDAFYLYMGGNELWA